MPNDSTFPPELVSAHASSLRALARTLALDEHAADDVVQETWLRALSSPPARSEGFGGWLRRVAEGFALQRHRSEARRAHREKTYARERPESVASADSRAETLRAVVEAVLSLEEPYRETVLLRWFEGLPPRDIAARLGASVATVNSRLQRAHGLLRERLSRRLDIDERKLQGLLLAMFGTGSASTAAAATSLSLVGATLTTTKLVLAGGIAAVALCAVIWWSGDDHVAPPLLGAANPDVALDGAQPAAADPDVEAQRVELGAVAPASAAATPPAEGPGEFEFDLTVVTVDPTGRPVSRVGVNVGLDMQRLAPLGASAWNGELHSTWRGTEPRLDMVLGVDKAPLRRIQLFAGAPLRIVVMIEDDAKAASREWRMTLTAKVASAKSSPETASFSLDGAGNGVFSDPWLLVAEEAPASLLELGARIDEIRFTEVKGRLLTLGYAAPAEKRGIRDAALIAGVVRDEHGVPQPGVLVTAFTERDAGRWESTTDVYGEFGYAVPSGRVIVYAGGGERVLAHRAMELGVDETGRFDLSCPKLALTRVRLLDAEKKPLADWHLEGRHAGVDGAITGRGMTDEQGRAQIFLPHGRLYVGPSASGLAPKVPLDPLVLGGDPETEIVLGKDEKPGLIFVAMEAPTSPAGEARLWRADSNEGQRMSLVDVSVQPATGMHRALYRCEKLMPGAYTIEHGAPGLPWKKIGPIYLESGQDLDAGTHRLDEPARLAVDVTNGAKASVMVRTRAQGLVLQSPPASVTKPTELPFESGAWTLSTGVEQSGSVRAASRAIQAAPGQRIQALAPADAPPR